MAFENTFCPSPWFHMRINNSGTYEFCRWMNHGGLSRQGHATIHSTAPLEYFQRTMSPIRAKFLNGEMTDACATCKEMEAHGKISGRERQLLKAGIRKSYFEQTLASSPMRADFDYSQLNNGDTLRSVSDWQVDLGNYCNGACVFCSPENSSRLAAEFRQLELIDRLPPVAWCDDPVLLEKFIKDLTASDKLRYIHFIGGETVITPGFKKILQALIERQIAERISIGFTTNLLAWDEEINSLLTQFKEVNLGLSVETLTAVNDYVRWPCQQDTTYQTLERWRQLGEQNNWLIQLRITPTCLTIHDLASVYDYAWNHNIAVESCNFLYEPKFMRIGVLPREQREWARERLARWVDSHQTAVDETVINTRDPNRAHDQIYQDALSYIDHLETAEDESFRLPELATYLKKLESRRGNSIINTIPEYEQILRSAGY
jgi:hypothetical protein